MPPKTGREGNRLAVCSDIQGQGQWAYARLGAGSSRGCGQKSGNCRGDGTARFQAQGSQAGGKLKWRGKRTQEELSVS